MKKIISLLSLLTILTFAGYAQQATLYLQYYKSIEKNEGKWTKWPTEIQDAKKNNEYITELTIKKIDSEIFNVDFYYGGSMRGMFTDNVVYDPTKTESVRKANNNKNITCYRMTGTKTNFIWTENITLAELYANPSKWKTTPNAKIYTWDEDNEYGYATVFYGSVSSTQSAPFAKNFKITFKDESTKVKGSWTAFPKNYTTAPSNTYVQIKVIKDRLKFNFKYYENGKLVKDYNITYDDVQTKKKRETNPNISIYTIDGSTTDFIELHNISITGIINDPKSWETLNNAVIFIRDGGKTNTNTRLK